MKKRNLISVILVVALLLSCSLSVLAAVPPKGETAEPQLAKIACERCGAEATIVSTQAIENRVVRLPAGVCTEGGPSDSHTHTYVYSGIKIDCPNCGKYLANATLLRSFCNSK